MYISLVHIFINFGNILLWEVFPYTNTASVKIADRPSMCYIFEKAMVQGPQKVFDKNKVCDMQMHKYIYTNTAWVKFPDRPNMSYIFEMVMVRGPQKQCS